VSGLLGVAVHRALPQGQKIGAIVWHDGEKYYVTQAEMDRLNNLPTATEIRTMVAKLEALMKGTTHD
jgi:uncharacterized protein (UPF0216 family)